MDDKQVDWLAERLHRYEEHISGIRNRLLPLEEMDDRMRARWTKERRKAHHAKMKAYWTPERRESRRKIYREIFTPPDKPEKQKRTPEEVARICSEAGRAYWTPERIEAARQVGAQYREETRARKEAEKAERAKAREEARKAAKEAKRKRAGIIMPSDFLANPEAYLKSNPLAEIPGTSTSQMIAQLHAMQEELHGVEFDPEMDDEALMEKLLAEEELE